MTFQSAYTSIEIVSPYSSAILNPLIIREIVTYLCYGKIDIIARSKNSSRVGESRYVYTPYIIIDIATGRERGREDKRRGGTRPNTRMTRDDRGSASPPHPGGRTFTVARRRRASFCFSSVVCLSSVFSRSYRSTSTEGLHRPRSRCRRPPRSRPCDSDSCAAPAGRATAPGWSACIADRDSPPAAAYRRSTCRGRSN